jgi:alanine dehydrogenase
MNKKVGIRYEDRFAMERRVAIIPADMEKIIKKSGLEFYVERSEKRVFKDKEYEEAGAQLMDDVSDIPVVFGVKEMPLSFFKKNHTYIFFSHTIKGQEYNMPALKKMMEMEVNLIDYEKVSDEDGKRLIFFGRYAGLAGMINSLWALGKRWQAKGMENPFTALLQSHRYESLEDARDAIQKIAEKIVEGALDKWPHPLVIGLTGYGNVSRGAQEILSLLPLIEISPAELLQIGKQGKWDSRKVYKVVFREKDLVRPVNERDGFELQDYYDHPEKYESVFEAYIDQLTVLMNCMYWDDRYPRLISNDYLKNNYDQNHPLQVIGDITCDPGGSIECTLNCTEIEAPNFIYHPEDGKITYGEKGEGVLVMAVDILPSELPRESSRAFSTALFPYVEAIVRADYDQPFEKLDLPGPIKRAMILHRGRLTPDYQYMEQYL